MNYIKMSPLAGISGMGGGTTGLTFGGAAAPEIQYGGRGIIAHKDTGYEYITISSTGNSASFGDQVEETVMGGPISSTSRVVFAGGSYNFDNSTDDMEYVTPDTTGNGTNFGDLSQSRKRCFGGSDGTRGLSAGGQSATANSEVDSIEYITIATTSNASNFGNGAAALCLLGQVSNDTYALFGGGGTHGSGSSYGWDDDIDYVTIQTTGNTSKIGDLTEARGEGACLASPTRGVWCCGRGANSYRKNILDYRTLDNSSGNASDFGDYTWAVNACCGMANETRGVISGGYSNTEGYLKYMKYITIASTGNAVTFGNLTGNRSYPSAASGGAV